MVTKAINQKTSREEAIKNLDTRMGFKFKMMKPDEQEALIRQEMGVPALPTGRTGGTGPASKLSDAEIKAQLGIK
jgi:hypothetical protein